MTFLPQTYSDFASLYYRGVGYDVSFVNIRDATVPTLSDFDLKYKFSHVNVITTSQHTCVNSRPF